MVKVAKVAEPASEGDGKADFNITDGVTRVAGRKIKDSEKTIRLSGAEAAYDLALGRISKVETVNT